MNQLQVIEGRALPLGDDVSTDVLHPPDYFSLDPEVVKRGFLAKFDPTIASWVRKGDVIIAGKNFGCGSSREAVVRSIVLNGISTIVAESFARIFFRTCINLGILCVTPKDGPISPQFERGEPLSIRLDDWTLARGNGLVYPLQPLPEFLVTLMQRGGILGLLT